MGVSVTAISADGVRNVTFIFRKCNDLQLKTAVRPKQGVQTLPPYGYTGSYGDNHETHDVGVDADDTSGTLHDGHHGEA